MTLSLSLTGKISHTKTMFPVCERGNILEEYTYIRKNSWNTGKILQS